MQLDFLQAEKRGNHTIHEEREKAACKASQNIKSLKVALGASKHMSGKDRLSEAITAKDRDLFQTDVNMWIALILMVDMCVVLFVVSARIGSRSPAWFLS